MPVEIASNLYYPEVERDQIRVEWIQRRREGAGLELGGGRWRDHQGWEWAPRKKEWLCLCLLAIASHGAAAMRGSAGVLGFWGSPVGQHKTPTQSLGRDQSFLE